MKKQFIIKIGLVLFLLSVFLPSAVSAQADLQKPELLVPLGDFSEFKDIDKRQCIGPDYKEGDQCYYIPWIAQYVQAAYKYGLILGSVLAVTIFVISGGLYLTSGLNPSLQQKAKGYMTGAVLGLTLLLGAYMVLRFINPDLIALRPLEVQVLKRKEIPDPFCSNVAKSEYFRVERLADEREAVTSNAAEYSSGGDKYMRCGVKYNVAVREQHRKNISMPVGQTCFGDVCEAKKYCKDFGGSARCVPAVLYGEIKKASRFNESVLSHSSITETFADSLEIDKSRFSLIHNDVGFWSNSEKLQSVDNTYLPQNFKYSFMASTDPENWSNKDSNQDWPVFLRVQINYAGSFTRDRIYYVDATGYPVGFSDSGRKCCTYVSDDRGNVSVKPGCNLFRVKDFKDTARLLDLHLNRFIDKDGPIKSNALFKTDNLNKPTCEGGQQAVPFGFMY